jgi:acyl-CoA hydrolase
MTPDSMTPDQIVREIARHSGGGRVFLTAGPAEPVALHAAWQAAPETAANLRFAGLFLPGVNRFDYASLHPTAGMDVVMLSPDWRGGFTSGQNRQRPMHYSQAYATLMREGADVGIFTLAPPRGGEVSFGLARDIGPDLLPRCRYRVAVVNAQMPWTPGPSVPLSMFQSAVHVDQPLPTLAESTPDADAIAAQVAAQVRDGDTIQTGVGKLPSAVMLALRQRKNLRVHSGLLTPAHLALARSGALADEPGAITGGVAAGDAAFYDAMAREPRLRLVSVAETHGAAALARIDNLVAINAALEIDLFGQINAELAGGRQISGTGGLVDFVRGARTSKGGRPFVMIQAEGKGGSRIVPRLTGPVTITRNDPPIVVTEHGLVDLAPLDIDARAHAIIELAAPAHRAGLQAAWNEMRAAL